MSDLTLHPAPLTLGETLRRSLLAPLVAILSALALHFFIVPLLSPQHSDFALTIGVNIILAVSLTIVNGFTGQFSIGHAGFMALGAFTAASITYYGAIIFFADDAFAGGALSASEDVVATGLVTGGDVLFLAGCLFAALVAGIAGLLVGLPSLRLRGDYLAIVTLGFAEIIRILLEQAPAQLMLEDKVLTLRAAQIEEIKAIGFPELFIRTGGAIGFGRLQPYASHFWVHAFVGLTILIAFRLKASSHGRALLAVRENEVAAASMGVPITRYKVTAFVISACFAGIAGALYAHQVRPIPEQFGFQKSFDILIMVVLGGLGSISGSALAAVIITLLPEILRNPPPLWPVMLVIIIVLAIMQHRRAIRPAIVLAVIAILWEIVRWVVGDLSPYRMVLFALALIVMMILRPQGLLGLREFWDRWVDRKRAAKVEAAA